MKALEFYVMYLHIIQSAYRDGKISKEEFVMDLSKYTAKAFEMAEQELKDAYKHGRDDENCALSDGAMASDYDNADEWYQGEYGGDK